MGDNAFLAAFVIFVWTVHIKKLQSGILFGNRAFFHDFPGGKAVKQSFAPAIGIKRPQAVQKIQRFVIGEPHVSVAVGCCGGCVNVLHIVFATEIPKFLA